MLTERDIGQLLMVGFPGGALKEDISELFEDVHPGGVILFARNTGTPDETTLLTSTLQQCAGAASLPPLIIAVDQEGGIVARLTSGFSVYPSSMAFGAVYASDPVLGLRYAAAASHMVASELRSVGVNMNFAPCLDVNTNPRNPVIGVRSYSDNGQITAELGTASLIGYGGNGVLPTAKHFPGHGDTHVDSHLGLPAMEWGLDQELHHILPFRAAIEARVPAIMTSHIVFSAGSPGGRSSNGLPVTLSRDILTGYLRGVLGYNGLIVTDCMEMAAISEHFGAARAAVTAVQAGADMVLVSHSRKLQRESKRALLEAYSAGVLDERDIRSKLRRIQSAKQVVAAPLQKNGETASSEAPSPAEVCARSITLLKREFAPAACGALGVISPGRFGSTGVEDFGSSPVGRILAERTAGAQSALYSQEPTGDEVTSALGIARSSGLVIAVSNNAHLSDARVNLLRQVIAENPNTVLLSVGAPFETMVLPEARYTVCSYGYAPAQLRAAFDVIMGLRPPQGCLPVEIPGHFPRGYGLNAEGKVIC